LLGARHSRCASLKLCVGTGTAHRVIPPNKKTYQQDPANYREALREAELDEAEGADIMMVDSCLLPLLGV
jgi:delta-aminolevulinic acid dehydratase/porphobilinogen synthase